MTRLRSFAVALALAALALASYQPSAEAAFGRVMCRSEAAGTAAGPGQVTNPNTSTSYALDGGGCAFIAQADVGYFVSQGYTPGATLRSITATGISAQNFAALILPPGAYIHDIVVQETSGASITGGLKFGTTAGGTDIATGVVCGSACLTSVKDVSMSKRVFSTTASQTVSVDAVSSWNSAAVSVTILYSLF